MPSLDLGAWMRRRQFLGVLGGVTAGWPLAVRAQQPAMPVVGYLSGRSLVSDPHLVAAFRRGVGEAGYVEGENVRFEFRWAEGRADRLPHLAAELAGRAVAVIFAGGVDVQVRAVKAAVSTVPIVIATGGDPVELGLVASLSRPGGNVTGATALTAVLWPKRLELLRELMHSPGVIAMLVNPDNAVGATGAREAQAAARNIGQNLVTLNVRDEGGFEPAFATLVRERAGALMVADDVLFINRRDKLIARVAQQAVPAIYGRNDFPASGGLMSYGASTIDQYYQCGLYAGRILKGAKPADLPFLQPTKFELVINLKAATALGLEIPSKLLFTADQVIE
jgi:putative ABC transport system substrate-binding protein